MKYNKNIVKTKMAKIDAYKYNILIKFAFKNL